VNKTSTSHKKAAQNKYLPVGNYLGGNIERNETIPFATYDNQITFRRTLEEPLDSFAVFYCIKENIKINEFS
jgi:hypothetical protein